MNHQLKRAAPLALVAAVLGGCASFSEDRGFGLAQQTARDRLGKDAAWIRTESDSDSVKAKVQSLLANPLSADDAVQIALYNNPGLQATYAELGISESDLVASGRIDNPRYAFMRAIDRNGETKIESLLSLGVMSLITLPLRMQAAGRRFESTQRGVTAEMLRTAGDTRKAYYQAVAAAQSMEYMGQVKESAEAGAELARRMVRAGNFSGLTQMREHAFYADATAQMARSQQASIGAREQLTRLMGLYDSSAFKLPERLPDLPKAPRGEDQIAKEAMQERLDVSAARFEAESMAAALGLTRITRFTNVLDLGRTRIDEGQSPRKRGWEIGFDIPIFVWGGARVAGAEARYLQAAERIRETAVNAQSEVRQTYSAYRIQYDLARHYRDQIVPLRKKISDEMQLRYNGMLKSVFELLADSREQVMAVNGAIEAQRDFWMAEADLQMALIGKPSSLGLGKEMAPMARQTGGGH